MRISTAALLILFDYDADLACLGAILFLIKQGEQVPASSADLLVIQGPESNRFSGASRLAWPLMLESYHPGL